MPDAEKTAPSVPEHWTTDDVLADQHARYHCEAGNMLYGDECGWECSFWEISVFLADAGLIPGTRVTPSAVAEQGADRSSLPPAAPSPCDYPECALVSDQCASRVTMQAGPCASSLPSVQEDTDG